MEQPLNTYLLPLDTIRIDYPDDPHVFDGAIEQLSEDALSILADFSVAEFLEERLRPLFQLSEEQKVSVARIIRDIVLQVAAPSDIGNAIASALGVPPAIAGQIARELNDAVFVPHNMPLLGEGNQESAPVLPEQISSVDDLLAVAQQLEPGERDSFFERAKEHNLLTVLRAQAQLRLVPGPDGKPRSLGELIAQNAARMMPEDWADLAELEPAVLEHPDARAALRPTLKAPEMVAEILQHMAPPALPPFEAAILAELRSASPATIQYLRYSPFWVGIRGKADQERSTLLDELWRLSEEDRTFLESPKTANAIASLVRQGAVRRELGSALAKVALFVVLRRLPPEMLPKVFSENFQLEPQQAAALSDAFKRQLLAGHIPAPESPRPQQATVQRGAPSNIIDLRRAAPTS